MAGSIFYYVSGHGFGHATRAAEVIRFLKSRRPDIPIHVRSSADHTIFHEMCRPDSCHSRSYDVGVIQSDGINMNIPATLDAYRTLSRSYPEIIADETRDACSLNARLIVTDIPPVAMRVAESLNIPGVIIANFTWDWIYEIWQDDYPDIKSLVSEIHEDYQKCRVLYRLPFSPLFDTFPNVQDIPLIARMAQSPRNEVRNRLRIPSDRPVILLSFGGMGLKTGNLSRLTSLDQYVFITFGSYGTPGLVINPSDLAANGLNYPDLVGAVDVVVSKPGYGIVSECAVNGIKMLYTDRGPFREYDILESEMKKWIHSQYIDRNNFENGVWEPYLEPLLKRTNNIKPAAYDGAAILADRLLNLFDEMGD